MPRPRNNFVSRGQKRRRGKLWEARLALSRTNETSAGSRRQPLGMALSVQPQPPVDRHDLRRIDQFGVAGDPPSPNPRASRGNLAPVANETASKELTCFRDRIVVRGGQGG